MGVKCYRRRKEGEGKSCRKNRKYEWMKEVGMFSEKSGDGRITYQRKTTITFNQIVWTDTHKFEIPFQTQILKHAKQTRFFTGGKKTSRRVIHLDMGEDKHTRCRWRGGTTKPWRRDSTNFCPEPNMSKCLAMRPNYLASDKSWGLVVVM